MTKFLDFYSIFPIPDPKEFLGISPDRKEGRALTTLGKSFVVILDIASNKQKHSWTTSDKLSTKVVYDRASERYVGTFGNRTLRCWDESTEDINKCKKLKFQRGIEDLITNDEGNAFVVYNDGFAEPLNVALQARKERIESIENELSQPFTLSKPQLWRVPDGRQLYTYFKRCNRSQKLTLISYFTAEEGVLLTNTFKEHVICEANLDVKAIGYTVAETEKGIVLISIWSDKRIFMLDILDKNSENQAPGQYVSVIGELDMSNPLCLAGVAKNFIVIYGSTAKKDGGLLLLYNIQYKVIKAKQYFKVYFDVARVWPTKEHLILALGQNLSAVKYRISKALLAELIGTQTNNTFDRTIEEEQVNVVEDFEESLNFLKEKAEDSSLIFSRKGKAIDSFLAHESAIKEFAPADGRRVPFEPFDDFERRLNQLTENLLHIDIVESNRGSPEIDIVSNLFEHDFSHPMILNLVRHMENCGSSEQEISEKLITILIKANRKKDIYACLSRYTNHSEKTLSMVLKYVLENCSESIEEVITAKDLILSRETPLNGSLLEENKDSEEINENEANKTNGKRRRTLSKGSVKSGDLSSPKQKLFQNKANLKKNKARLSNGTQGVDENKLDFQFLDYAIEQDFNIHTYEKALLENLPFDIKLLNIILSHNFHSEQMSAHLRSETSYHDMKTLLKYLFILIKGKDVFQFELFPTYLPSSSHFELQIFRWFGSLLNAHYQQMILSKDSNLVNLLYKWHKLFSLYKNETRELQETAAVLYKIVQKSKNPTDRNYIKWYSIEEVELF